MTTGVVYILVGMPGSGKSTWCLDRNFGVPIRCSSDHYIEDKAVADNITYNEAFPLYNKEATKYYNKTKQEAFNKKLPKIVLDRTHLTFGSRQKALGSIPKTYLKHAIVFERPWEDLVKVNEDRKAFGRHLPDNVLEFMYKTRESVGLDEGFDFITYESRRT